MIAGMFARHGVFTGSCYPPSHQNPKGFFENRKIKVRLKERFGFDLLGPLPEYQDGWNSEVMEIFKSEGYKGGELLVKAGAFYWKVWDAKFIKVKRDLPSIMKSFEKTGYLKSIYSTKQIEEIIVRQQHIMDEVPGVTIHSNNVVEGNYDDLVKAFDYCDLTFDPKIADEFVEKEYWHETN